MVANASFTLSVARKRQAAVRGLASSSWLLTTSTLTKHCKYSLWTLNFWASDSSLYNGLHKISLQRACFLLTIPLGKFQLILIRIRQCLQATDKTKGRERPICMGPFFHITAPLTNVRKTLGLRGPNGEDNCFSRPLLHITLPNYSNLPPTSPNASPGDLAVGRLQGFVAQWLVSSQNYRIHHSCSIPSYHFIFSSRSHSPEKNALLQQVFQHLIDIGAIKILQNSQG